MLKAENKINNISPPQNLLQRKKEGGKYILLYFPMKHFKPVQIFGFMENLQTGRFLSREEHLV